MKQIIQLLKDIKKELQDIRSIMESEKFVPEDSVNGKHLSKGKKTTFS